MDINVIQFTYDFFLSTKIIWNIAVIALRSKLDEVKVVYL